MRGGPDSAKTIAPRSAASMGPRRGGLWAAGASGHTGGMALTRRRFTALAALSPWTAGSLLANAASRGLAGGEHRLTLLYTNDFHSAFDPVPGYWLPGSPRLGGA